MTVLPQTGTALKDTDSGAFSARQGLGNQPETVNSICRTGDILETSSTGCGPSYGLLIKGPSQSVHKQGKDEDRPTRNPRFHWRR